MGCAESMYDEEPKEQKQLLKRRNSYEGNMNSISNSQISPQQTQQQQKQQEKQLPLTRKRSQTLRDSYYSSEVPIDALNGLPLTIVENLFAAGYGQISTCRVDDGQKKINAIKLNEGFVSRDLAHVCQLNPILLNPRNIKVYAKLLLWIKHGAQYTLIDDVDTFKYNYNNNTDACVRSGSKDEYYNVDDMTEPQTVASTLVFYVQNGNKELFKASVPYPCNTNSQIKYEELPKWPVGQSPYATDSMSTAFK